MEKVTSKSTFNEKRHLSAPIPKKVKEKIILKIFDSNIFDKSEKTIKNLKREITILKVKKKLLCGSKKIIKEIHEKEKLIESIKKNSEILEKYYRTGLNVQELVTNIRNGRINSNELVPLHFRKFQ